VEVSVFGKRIDQRLLLSIATVALASVLIIGCSTRPEVSENLPMAGNHSPGDLFMVTADTSSDGFHYLEPQMSPNNQRIVFTADWIALPVDPRNLPDTPLLDRQLVVVNMELQETILSQLSMSNAQLVRIAEGGPNMEIQKGSPVWINDESILFWIETDFGARLARLEVPQNLDGLLQPEIIYAEPSDGENSGMYWEHRDPAISPDGHWIAFSKSRYAIDGIPEDDDYGQQSIWVMEMPGLGSQSELVFQVTTEASIIANPSWSPDGTKIVFNSNINLDSGLNSPLEIFTIDFDVTEAENNNAILDLNINRLTNSENNDHIPIRNWAPVFSPDGMNILFVSDRRAPSITLHERSIWSIPSDGGLEPSILFFSREDDIDVSFAPGQSDMIIFSSGMGFPTEMLDRIEQEDYERFLEEDPSMTSVQAAEEAASIRTGLEFFEGVMSHIMVFSNWD
jgi:hypothetical protein